MGYVRNFAQFLQKSLILRMFLFKCEHKSAVGFAVDFAVEKIEITLNKFFFFQG